MAAGSDALLLLLGRLSAFSYRNESYFSRSDLERYQQRMDLRYFFVVFKL